MTRIQFRSVGPSCGSVRRAKQEQTERTELRAEVSVSSVNSCSNFCFPCKSVSSVLSNVIRGPFVNWLRPQAKPGPLCLCRSYPFHLISKRCDPRLKRRFFFPFDFSAFLWVAAEGRAGFFVFSAVTLSKWLDGK